MAKFLSPGFAVMLFLTASLGLGLNSSESRPSAAERVHQGDAPEYIEIIRMYRNGMYDVALRHLQNVDPQQVLNRLGSPEQRSLPPRDERHIKDPLFRPGDDLLRAAALMHTELAMKKANEFHFRENATQLEIAERLIERIRNPATREGFRRDWLLANGYFFQASVFELGVLDGYELAKEHFDEAVKRFPDDAEICLSAGALHEWAGSLKYGDKSELKRAEELYRLALKANPELGETHLRYGRVLVKRGRDDGAVSYLLEALQNDDGPTPFVSYVARMMLGGIAERKGDLKSAIVSYKEAANLIPSWETAKLALSHALHVAGQHEESSRVLASTVGVATSSAEDFDGWMVYELGHAMRLEALLASMKAEIPR
jgi:tetratricopeptide (TPR) repeat protein